MESVLNFLLGCIGLLKFWEVLHEYEEGVVLTFGRPRRAEYIVGPGLVLIWPFGIEEVLSFNKGINCKTLQEQTVQTADGHTVAVCGTIIWKVRDVYKLAVEVEDDEE